MKDIVRLTTSAKVPDKEQQERLSEVSQTLIQERGYCPHCANEMIRYVGTLLAK
jgi:serine protein kinase